MAQCTRRDFMKVAGAGSLAALSAGQQDVAPTQCPNIVFVFGDQHRNSSWGGGDDPQVLTPNLDRIAHEGAAFNHCISTYPLCCPYRASLMTGRYPQSTTIMSNSLGQEGLPLSEVTIAENTIVVYTSDHGDMLGSFNMWAKQKPWEESINVPFVIHWPKAIRGGKRLNTLFSTPDIAPTLLGLMGVPAPSPMQGIDLSPLLLGKRIREPESAFILARGSGSGNDEEADEVPSKAKRAQKRASATPARRTAARKQAKNPGEWRGVRTVRYTYARQEGRRGREPWVLYDNEKDPFQMRNLANDSGADRLRRDMDALVEQWCKRVGED